MITVRLVCDEGNTAKYQREVERIGYEVDFMLGRQVEGMICQPMLGGETTFRRIIDYSIPLGYEEAVVSHGIGVDRELIYLSRLGNAPDIAPLTDTLMSLCNPPSGILESAMRSPTKSWIGS